MLRTTDVAIVAVPVLACLAVFGAVGLMGRPVAVDSLPSLRPSTQSSATQSLSIQSPATPAPVVIPAAPATAAATPKTTVRVDSASQDATPTAPATPETATLQRGRELADLLYSQRLTALWNTFTPAVRQEWGSFSQFQAYRTGGLKAFGAERKVVSEQVRSSGGVDYYTRTASFERGPQHPWTLVLGLNPARQVVAFNIVNSGVLPTDPRQ